MAKNKTQSVGDLISEIKEDVVSSSNEKTAIPDIISFCEDEEWLGLPFHPTNPLRLFPMQKIILKAFYRGSIGNENVVLTDKEIELCKETGLIDDEKGDVVGKYNNEELFRELILVWGRRASKDFIVSIIALYEAMKLLECPGGDPYALYELSSATTINILTVANAKDQARRAFEEIREKLLYSPYFQDKYSKDGISAASIYLLTPQDKKDNINFRAKKLPVKKGSIGIIVGHSNSDSLLGMGCIVLILDEVASFKSTGGSGSGDRIYTALTPTVSTYCRKIYARDEDGNYAVDENDQRIIKKRENFDFAPTHERLEPIYKPQPAEEHQRIIEPEPIRQEIKPEELRGPEIGELRGEVQPPNIDDVKVIMPPKLYRPLDEPKPPITGDGRSANGPGGGEVRSLSAPIGNVGGGGSNPPAEVKP